MDEYIKREDALMKLMQDGCSAKNLQSISDMPGANAVSLHDIYRVIAGHSYYHGDRILAALTCIAEGKEVNPVRPADVAPVVRCKDCKHLRVWNQKNIYAFYPKTTIVFLPFEQDTRTFFCSYGERKENDHEKV